MSDTYNSCGASIENGYHGRLRRIQNAMMNVKSNQIARLGRNGILQMG